LSGGAAGQNSPDYSGTNSVRDAPGAGVEGAPLRHLRAIYG